MLFYKTKVKQSAIRGQGLFAEEDIPKKALIGILVLGFPIMTEEEYQQAQRDGNNEVIMTSIRWVDKWFMYGNKITNEEYINHSSNPNMLYHCGMLFAREDISHGEELTADYKYFLAVNDVERFTDQETGKLVDGIDGKQCLLQSIEELYHLLKT